MSNIQKLSNWFLKSNIYDHGAYVSYYKGNKRGPIYPEITAYAITVSSLLYKKTKERAYLERAEECAQYMSTITKNGGVPSLTDKLLYVFDTGIYVTGLFDLYDITKKEAYLRQAEQSLSWIYSNWDGNRFTAIPSDQSGPEWYHDSSVHLAKMAIPLLKAAEHLQNSEHEKKAYKLLETFQRLQTAEGNFQLLESRPLTMSHPHCYATEGFLYAYNYSQKSEYLNVIKKASDWLKTNQNKDGSIYRTYPLKRDSDEKPDMVGTSDATSQSIRIWKILGVNQEGIDRANMFLTAQLKDGGLRLFKQPSLKSKALSWRDAVHSWPTFFYLHSLMLPFGDIQYSKEIF